MKEQPRIVRYGLHPQIILTFLELSQLHETGNHPCLLK